VKYYLTPTSLFMEAKDKSRNLRLTADRQGVALDNALRTHGLLAIRLAIKLDTGVVSYVLSPMAKSLRCP
jgi:hypothetical protein